MNDTASVRVMIVATSLSGDSRSQVLARYVKGVLEEREVHVDLIDLRECNLPVYGAEMDSKAHAAMKRIEEIGKLATHVIFSVPVYNYAVSGGTKNFIEHAGGVLGNKTVGIMSAAGGSASYLAPIPFANSLMLDFRCWIVPRFIQCYGGDFEGDTVKNADLVKRVNDFLTIALGRVAEPVAA